MPATPATLFIGALIRYRDDAGASRTGRVIAVTQYATGGVGPSAKVLDFRTREHIVVPCTAIYRVTRSYGA